MILVSVSCSMRMELGYLYRQPIENTSKVIYHFTYLADFVTNSDYSGYVILDSTINFSEKEARDCRLRGGFVDSIKHNEINMLYLTWDENYSKENDSIGYFIDTFGNIKVTTTQYNSGWGNTNRYYFDKMIDNDKNVTFIGLEKKYGRDLPDSVIFRKGGMFVYEKDGFISSIFFSKIRTRRKENGMIQYGKESFQFNPKDSILVSELSDYGYFKLVK